MIGPVPSSCDTFIQSFPITEWEKDCCVFVEWFLQTSESLTPGIQADTVIESGGGR